MSVVKTLVPAVYLKKTSKRAECMSCGDERRMTLIDSDGSMFCSVGCVVDWHGELQMGEDVFRGRNVDVRA